MLLNRTMQTIDPIEAQALSIVSYIGCTVSIICLALTIIFFISFGSVCTSILTSSYYVLCVQEEVVCICQLLRPSEPGSCSSGCIDSVCDGHRDSYQ